MTKQHAHACGTKSPFSFSGRADRQYVFAYATNMHPDQMAERCSRPTCLGQAVLKDHTLGFFGHTETWDGGQATAVPAPGKELWGVVYELTYTDAQRLDEWQGARLDGAGSYFHHPALVRGQDGREHTLLLYKKEIQGAHGLPSREMLAYIIEAARLRGLPEPYLKELARRPARKAAYVVPLRAGLLRGLTVVTSCRDCGA